MTVVLNSNYNPKHVFKSKHFNTVYRTLFQKNDIQYQRTRLELDDGDFLDIDFSRVHSTKLIVLIHGLEGSSDSAYIKSLVSYLNDNKLDIAVINLRGCSGEINRLLYAYHSGKTDDVDFVINYIHKNFSYSELHLVGFSLGGNLIFKYLGEMGATVLNKINSAVTISVPCDLHGSSLELTKFKNKVYMQRFLKSLKFKLKLKKSQFPDSFIDLDKVNQASSFYDIDNLYTAPAHGFKNAYDYWEKCSSKQFIYNIKVPTKLITSSDDPFLSNSCIPIKEAKNNSNFYLEKTLYGGHVGFNHSFDKKKNIWLESKILNFINQQN